MVVASLCQWASNLSALVLHSITHSLSHSLNSSLPHTNAHCSSQTGCQSHLLWEKQQHCPLLARLTCHPDRMMSHLKNDHTEQLLTLALSHWFINLLWEKREDFFIVEWWIRVEGWCTFACPDSAISLTESLPLRACYWDIHFTSTGDSWWNSACVRDGPGPESLGEGNYLLWSLWNDMSLRDSFCYFDRREEE